MSEQLGVAAGTADTHLTHHREPWDTAPQKINPANYLNLVDADGKFLMLGSVADVLRVKACVNFCRGIPTEVLERMAHGECAEGSIIVNGVESTVRMRLAGSRDLVAMPTLLVGASDQESREFERPTLAEVVPANSAEQFHRDQASAATERFFEDTGGAPRVSSHAAIGGAL